MIIFIIIIAILLLCRILLALIPNDKNINYALVNNGTSLLLRAYSVSGCVVVCLQSEMAER